MRGKRAKTAVKYQKNLPAKQAGRYKISSESPSNVQQASPPNWLFPKLVYEPLQGWLLFKLREVVE